MRKIGLRFLAAAVTAGAAAAGTSLAGGAAGATALADVVHAAPAVTQAPTATGGGPVSYGFKTLDDRADPTFNQLLGINGNGTIAGYFGSGAAGHPNQGYRLLPPPGRQLPERELPRRRADPGHRAEQPGRDGRVLVVGEQRQHGQRQLRLLGAWRPVPHANFPRGTPASPPVDQLLGVNDSGVAVGFWADANGDNHGYLVNVSTGTYRSVTDPNAPGASLTAAAINSGGAIAGFYTNQSGNTDGFLMAGNTFIDLSVPGASSTMALGVNDNDEVVGAYTAGRGSSAATHGFSWTLGGGFQSIDDPRGVGTTTINGVNDAGDLVGFYVDGAGNTDGMLAAPKAAVQVPQVPMPQGTVTLGRDGSGAVDAAVTAFGLTPGSSHVVELVNPAGGVIASFGTLTANGVGAAQATLDSGDKSTPGQWSVVILNGTAGDPVSTEPIAETAGSTAGTNTYQFLPVEVGPHGASHGTPQGSAVVSYDPNAQAISVTVNASGLTPGAHAAHIHLGSCRSQGAVQYVLTDFTASQAGQIVNQTRTVTNVTTPLPASGWYLNLHQGDSSNILSNGRPTIDFRPLLCGDIRPVG